MAKILLLLICGFSLSACSIYRSAVRKEFESNAPDYVTNKGLGTCETVSALPAWLEKEFPSDDTELLVADPDLEVWKRTDKSGRVWIRSFRALNGGDNETCLRNYSNETEWDQDRVSYFSRLENSILD